MAITRTAIVDDDGSLITGTIWNNAWKTELYNQIDAVDLAGFDTQTKTGDYTMIDTDLAVQFTTGGHNLNLTALASMGNRLRTAVNASASGVITIDPNAGEAIWDTGTNKTTTKLGPGEALIFAKRDATSWMVVGRNGSLKRCLVTRSASQTIGTGANVKVQFDSESLDVFTEFDPVTNFRWVAGEAMEIHVVAQAYFTAPTGRVQLLIYKNGAYAALVSNDSEGVDWAGQTSWGGAVATSDYIEAYVRHDHGGDRTLVSGVTNTFLSIRRTG